MRCFILLLPFFGSVFAAPQGYEYKHLAPPFENNNFQTIEPPKFLPCTQTNIFNAESEARIVNHKLNPDVNQNPITSTSGSNYQSQHNIAGNVGNFFAHSVSPINEDKFQSPVITQGYNYNQAASNADSSVTGHHNLLSSHFINSEQNNKAGYVHFNNRVNSAFVNKNLQHTSNVLLTGDNGHFGNALNGHSSDKNIHIASGDSQLNLITLSGQLGHVIRETISTAPLDPTVEKHIYVHVPPEDEVEEYQNKITTQNQHKVAPKKHYKLIFIKAPSYPSPNYNQLAEAVVPQVEEKTLVYVLVKKPEEPSLEHIHQLQQSSFKSSKPEVYFIKYKTRKEEDNNQYVTNSQNEIYTTTNIQNGNTGDIIDIRSGGEEITKTSSTSSSSPPLEATVNGDFKHELYGVPLQ